MPASATRSRATADARAADPAGGSSGELDEPRGRQVAAPGFEIVVRAIASAAPAFLVIAARVRAEQHATRLQRCAQFPHHARQCLAEGHETAAALAKTPSKRPSGRSSARKSCCHTSHPLCARAIAAKRAAPSRPIRDVPERGKRHEVAPRPAAEIEDRERRLALDESQQRRDVLADVVIARASPELLGMLLVVIQRAVGDRPQDRESGVIHGADDRTTDILSIRSAR